MIAIPDLARLREYIGCEVGTNTYELVPFGGFHMFREPHGPYVHVFEPTPHPVVPSAFRHTDP